jgi:hypothetical protein
VLSPPYKATGAEVCRGSRREISGYLLEEFWLLSTLISCREVYREVDGVNARGAQMSKAGAIQSQDREEQKAEEKVGMLVQKQQAELRRPDS